MQGSFRTTHFANLFSDGVEPEAPASPAQRRRRRMELFRESAGLRFARLCADLTHALAPRRLPALPGAIDFLIREKGIGVAGLPDPRLGRRAPDGLAGLVSDFTPASLVDAYSRGLFVRWAFGCATYWAPHRRIVAKPRDVTQGAELVRLTAEDGLRITLDRDFDAVIRAATQQAIRARRAHAPPAGGMHAFAALHEAGFAHSVEIHDRSGALCGGLYGVACGRVFVIQARFGRRPALADLACAALARHLESWGFALIDGCDDAALERAGFTTMSRDDHLALLPHAISGGRPGRWLVVPALLAALPAQADRAMAAT